MNQYEIGNDIEFSKVKKLQNNQTGKKPPSTNTKVKVITVQRCQLFQPVRNLLKSQEQFIDDKG